MVESQHTILFVEDAPDLRTQMQEALSLEGITMLEAADVDEALAVSRKEHPDLILLDLILPAGGGLRLLEILRDDQELKDIPVVVLTNLDDADHVGKALALGAQSYLVKAHYNLNDILDHIRPHLSLKKNRKA